ncbi:D-2-hydroxyacid dehydrogenase [Streptomyces sp. NPDC000880]
MTRLVMLPPQDDVTRSWAEAVSAVDELKVRIAETREEALELLPGAEAAFGTLDPDLLAAAPQLRWLQAPMAAPPPGYFFEELVAHPVEVTNFRGIYNDHVATHAVAMVLALARGLHRYARQQADGAWVRHLDDSDVVHLPEATAVVVGVGGIGAEIGRMLNAFGVTVLGVDPQRESPPEGVRSMHSPAELDTLLPRADVVVLTLPHTPESEGLINDERLALLPPRALLVNIGRGPTVSLDAVCAALDSGRLGGVGLDVFEIEPLPADHPLWRHPKAIVTPHVAVVGPYINDRRLEVFRTNAVRFAAGEPLVNVVSKNLWY